MKLYRPAGMKELSLIAASGWIAFPSRLTWQPIFYPVLNELYAVQIARDWNANDEFSGYCGIVTSFEIDDDYAIQFPIQNVGASMHDELWIPAEQLAEFNEHIVGKISVTQVFFGPIFKMPDDEKLAETLNKFLQS